MPRKRSIGEVDSAPDPHQPHLPLLSNLRNMWEFACLMQYIHLFGDAVKISKEVDMDMLEMECCRPEASDLLPQIGLALLKNVSSHRGLTPDLFDEYTRRQYLAKAPQRNPFGTDEIPHGFSDFDISQRIRILHQLSVWTLNNPDRIRQFYADEIFDHTVWRMDPVGYDALDRRYLVLDDNRLYRMTKPQVVEVVKSKQHAKAFSRTVKGSRSSKRQKLANGQAGQDDTGDGTVGGTIDPIAPSADHGLGGASWECIAISLGDYNGFLGSIKKSKDMDEKGLYQYITKNVLPEIERQAVSRERKEAAQRRELTNLQKMATAKRSTRIACKQEKYKEIREAEEQERRRRAELEMARREDEKQRSIEEARESRMVTREQRLKEREVRRILHEEEIRALEAQSQNGDTIEGRISERQRKSDMEKKKQELEKFSEEDDDWYFDCAICGVHGRNLDDGSHSLACEKCGVWQHSACHGIKEADAERDDFCFLCASCSNPRPIKIKVQTIKPIVHADKPGTVPSASTADSSTSNLLKAKASVMNRDKKAPQQNWKTVPASDAARHIPPDQPIRAPNSANGIISVSDDARGFDPSRADPGDEAFLRTRPLIHDPFYHGLGRARPASSSLQQSSKPGASGHHHGRSPLQSSNAQVNPLQGEALSPAPQIRHCSNTPLSSAHTLPIAPSPTLTPTEGSTSVRFSHQSLASSAYVPSSNHPAPAAMSPTKQTSPPARLMHSQNVASDGRQTAQINGLNSSSYASYVEHDLGGSPLRRHPHSSPHFVPFSSVTPKAQGSIAEMRGTSPSTSTSLSSPPRLQPNVGIENVTERGFNPPVKRPRESSPRVMATAGAQAYKQGEPA